MLDHEERDGLPQRLASDGQPYVTLTHCGIKDEGADYLYLVASVSKADAEIKLAALYRQEFESLCGQHPGTIIEWRSRPEAWFIEVAVNAGTWAESKMYAGAMRARLAFVAKQAVAA